MEVWCSHFNLCYKTPGNYTFTPSAVGRRRIYTKKMSLRRLTAAEQEISAVNHCHVSFFNKLKSENINYKKKKMFELDFFLP